MAKMIQILFIIIAGCASYTAGQFCDGLNSNANCYFNGIYYRYGDTLPGACFVLTCIRNGNELKWDYTYDNVNCSYCRARNDPHFKTFDGLEYDWHGLCNYTLTQYFTCPTNCSYYPKYGVYCDFYLCNSATASCVGDSTYKVNENTVITIKYLTLQTYVNGYEINLPTTPTLLCNIPQPTDVHPVIAWRDVLDCVNFQGIDFSIRACDISIHIYTTKDHLKLLDGLCGYYTGNVMDEFLTRDCNQLSLTDVNIPPFAKSWITLQQKDDGECCPKEEDKIPSKIKCINENTFREICTQAVDGYQIKNSKERSSLIENCVSDCCRAPDGACEEVWIPNTMKLAEGVVKFGE